MFSDPITGASTAVPSYQVQEYEEAIFDRSEAAERTGGANSSGKSSRLGGMTRKTEAIKQQMDKHDPAAGFLSKSLVNGDIMLGKASDFGQVIGIHRVRAKTVNTTSELLRNTLIFSFVDAIAGGIGEGIRAKPDPTEDLFTVVVNKDGKPLFDRGRPVVRELGASEVMRETAIAYIEGGGGIFSGSMLKKAEKSHGKDAIEKVGSDFYTALDGVSQMMAGVRSADQVQTGQDRAGVIGAVHGQQGGTSLSPLEKKRVAAFSGEMVAKGLRDLTKSVKGHVDADGYIVGADGERATFKLQVPQLGEDGKIQRDSKGKGVYNTEEHAVNVGRLEDMIRVTNHVIGEDYCLDERQIPGRRQERKKGADVTAGDGGSSAPLNKSRTPDIEVSDGDASVARARQKQHTEQTEKELRNQMASRTALIAGLFTQSGITTEQFKQIVGIGKDTSVTVDSNQVTLERPDDEQGAVSLEQAVLNSTRNDPQRSLAIMDAAVAKMEMVAELATSDKLASVSGEELAAMSGAIAENSEQDKGKKLRLNKETLALETWKDGAKEPVSSRPMTQIEGEKFVRSVQEKSLNDNYKALVKETGSVEKADHLVKEMFSDQKLQFNDKEPVLDTLKNASEEGAVQRMNIRLHMDNATDDFLETGQIAESAQLKSGQEFAVSAGAESRAVEQMSGIATAGQDIISAENSEQSASVEQVNSANQNVTSDREGESAVKGGESENKTPLHEMIADPEKAQSLQTMPADQLTDLLTDKVADQLPDALHTPDQKLAMAAIMMRQMVPDEGIASAEDAIKLEAHEHSRAAVAAAMEKGDAPTQKKTRGKIIAAVANFERTGNIIEAKQREDKMPPAMQEDIASLQEASTSSVADSSQEGDVANGMDASVAHVAKQCGAAISDAGKGMDRHKVTPRDPVLGGKDGASISGKNPPPTEGRGRA